MFANLLILKKLQKCMPTKIKFTVFCVVFTFFLLVTEITFPFCFCIIQEVTMITKHYSIHLYLKVAFIGISNWALDPAKMNRGILVQREVPDETELLESAK